MPKTGSAPLPYKKTAETPNLGFVDSSDDIRGGMGVEGLAELAKFVQEGGTLITEGSTATIFPEYGITTGVTVEEPAQLFVARLDPARRDHRHEEPDRLRLRQRRSAGLLQPGAGAERRRAADSAGSAAAAAARRGRTRTRGIGQNVTPNAVPLRIQPFEADAEPRRRRGRGERPAGRRHGADAADGAAVRDRHRRHASARGDAVPGESERHAAVGHARQRPVPREPRGGARRSRSARGTS